MISTIVRYYNSLAFKENNSVLFTIMLLFLIGCNNQQDPTPKLLELPTITEVTPTTGKKNTIVGIVGTGFSEIKSENIVFFNEKLAKVIDASSTLIKVEVPVSAGTGLITVKIKDHLVTGPTFEYLKSVTVSTFAGSGESGYVDGQGVDAKFRNPTGLDIDALGNLYVADIADNRIRMISPNGEVSTIAGSGTSGYLDGDSEQAQFKAPGAVAVDETGNVYVADVVNNRIRKISPQGIVSTLAGSGVNGWADGDGINAVFNNPQGISTDSNGNIYVSDTQNTCIRKITPEGKVTTIAGRPRNINDPKGEFSDGTGSDAIFQLPYGIRVNKNGSIYVADRNNNRVREVSLDGQTSTIAGNNNCGFINDQGVSAEFCLPSGVATDSHGNIYVADERNHIIRMISTTGEVLTLAGTGTPGFSDGDAEIAQFYYPFDVVVDEGGNIYVADYFNRRIRKITIE